MGLDQTLNWIGKPSKNQVSRWHHRDIRDQMIYMNWTDEPDQDKYKNIRKFMIPEDVYVHETNWELVTKDCGMPTDSRICMIGCNKIAFGDSYNSDSVKEFNINIWNNPKYDLLILKKLYFWLDEEVYRWRNNYEIQDLINELHPDVYCDYKDKYEMVYSGYYAVNKSLFNKIKKLDKNFNIDYESNLFYEADW